MLNLPLTTDEAAFEYGFGFGEDFELDYKAFTEAHSHKLPKAMHLQPEFAGVSLLSHLPTHPPQVLQLTGIPPAHLSPLLMPIPL